MTWADRLREEITLLSPGGNEFVAKWSGNPHSLTNKVSIDTFPGVSGAKVKDFRSGPEIYILTLFFDGVDNDLDATSFMTELQNNEGDWRIEHPVKGPLFAIWTRAGENLDPISSGGITTVETEWVINLPDTQEESDVQAQALAEAQSDQTNATAAEQFDAVANVSDPGGEQSLISSVGKVLTAVNKNLAIVENFALLDPRIQAIATSIQNTLSGDIIDTSKLAGQLQAYIQIFGLGQSNAVDSVTMYSDFAAEVLLDVPEQPDSDGISTVAVTELVVTAALVGAGQGALIGGLQSRPQVITTAIKMAELLETITNGLDSVQALYADNPIDNRYFSQSDSYADSLIMMFRANRFLFLSLLGFPSERRIVLRENVAVPQLAKNEYGWIGNEESETFYIDLLIASNELIEDETYMLKAGRQVLIYQF